MEGSINLEAHGQTVFAFFDVVGADVFDSTASQATALGRENGVQYWRFHRGRNFRIRYQPLFFVAAAQYFVFGKNRTANISANTQNHGRIGKSTT